MMARFSGDEPLTLPYLLRSIGGPIAVTKDPDTSVLFLISYHGY